MAHLSFESANLRGQVLSGRVHVVIEAVMKNDKRIRPGRKQRVGKCIGLRNSKGNGEKSSTKYGADLGHIQIMS